MPRPDAALARLAALTAPLLDERRRHLALIDSEHTPGAETRPAGYRIGSVHTAEEPTDPAAPPGEQDTPPAEGEEQDKPEQPAASTADVYVFDTIGAWGVSADDFVRDVATLDVDHIDLHINTPGGDAFDGAAIANVLRQHRASVTVWVDGLAASAGATIAMAGDEIVMSAGSQLMIHDAWTMAVGNAGDLRQQAAVLDTVSNTIAETFTARAGGTRETWRAAMVSESWYTPSEAVAAGLADRVASSEDRGRATGQQVTPGAGRYDDWAMWDQLSAVDRHDLTAFAHAGRANAPAPPMPNQVRGSHAPAGNPRPPAPAGSTTTGRSAVVDFPDEQVAPLRMQLGLTDDADGAAILAALTDRLSHTPDPATAAQARQAGDLVTTLRDQVARQESQLKTLTTERNARVKADFFSDQARRGAIEPNERPALEKAYDTSPETIRDLLLARDNNSRVPVNAIGYTGDTGESVSADEATYAALFGAEKKG